MRVRTIAAALIAVAALACTSRSGEEGAPAEPASDPAQVRDTASDASPAAPAEEAALPPGAAPAEPSDPASNDPSAAASGEPTAPTSDRGDGLNEATPPPKGSLRLVVLHAPPDLLKSEERQVLALEETLQAQGLRVTREPGRADERSYAAAGDEGATLPADWERFESVVLLRLAEPTVNRKGKRFAQGIRDLLIVRPPSSTPVFSERSSAEAGVRLQGKVQAQWILSILAGLQAQGEER